RPSLALKISFPFKTVKRGGDDEPEPLLISATCVVPASDPSVDHNSPPLPAALAAKKMREPKRKKLFGVDDIGLAVAVELMSLTRYGDWARNASGAMSVTRTATVSCLIDSVAGGALTRLDHAHL